MRMEMRMKKLITGIALAAFFTFGIAGQAAAAIELGQIYQCIYEGTTDIGYEFATDVGSAMSLANQTVYSGQPAEDLSDFVTTTVWADMYVGFGSAYSRTEDVGHMPFHKDYYKDAFFATTPAAASHASDLVDRDQFLTFQSGIGGALMSSVTSGIRREKSYPVSYWEKIEFLSGSMDNAQGVYAGFMNYDKREYGFASLAPLDEGPGSYVDMLLWQYHTYDGFWEPDHEGLVNIDGEYEDTYVAKLRIGLDGEGNLYTTTNPVPIPGAVWLLGSGLLGLVGIKRRKLA